MARITLILAIVPFACPPIAFAGNCNQFFYKQAAVVVAPVVAVPQVYYQAGRDLEAEALAEKVARLAVPRIIEQLKAGSTMQQNAASPSTSALTQHCAKCHSGSAPKAGIVLDGRSELLCSQVTSSLRAIRDELMPKDHKVSPEVKGQLMEELLNLERIDR